MEIQNKGGKMAEIQIRGKRPIILGTREDKKKKGEHSLYAGPHSVDMPHWEEAQMEHGALCLQLH